jgi:hypothetical protein
MMVQILDASGSNLNGVIALEIKVYCIRLVNYAIQCLFLGIGKGFLTNLLLLPENC